MIPRSWLYYHVFLTDAYLPPCGAVLAAVAGAPAWAAFAALLIGEATRRALLWPR